MQVKSIAKCLEEHSAILSICIKLPCVINTFVLSIFEWSFYTGFTIIAVLKFVIVHSIFFDEIVVW